jgi:hypothetical protein
MIIAGRPRNSVYLATAAERVVDPSVAAARRAPLLALRLEARVPSRHD